ncbi:MAG: EamA family transporter [Alphaproteobacteria bacterium]|nr:EamA family transporter [Alphaproteobacteria bacterium]
MQIFLAFAGCVLIWGSTWYAIELQLGIVPKEWSLVYRFSIASSLLFLISFLRREKLNIGRTGHIWTALTGCFLFSGTYIFTYTGAQYLTSGLVAVTFSLLSFLNLVNGRIFLKNAINSQAMTAALIGISGLILIFEPEVQEFSFADNGAKGLFFCLVATLACSFGNTAAGAPQSQRISLLPFNAFSLGYGAILNFIYALSTGETATFDPSASYVGSLLYLAIVGTVVAFSMYIWLIDQIGVGRASYMSVMTPVIALGISTVMEGFVWSNEAMIGLALVIIGNILMIRIKTAHADHTGAKRLFMKRG